MRSEYAVFKVLNKVIFKFLPCNMKHKKTMLCTMLLVGFGLLRVNAQVAVPASGGEGSGNGGAVSYSVGQVFFSSHAGEAGSVSEGVQAAYEITVISGKITDSTELLAAGTGFSAILPDLYAYPNPTTDVLTLRIGNYQENEEASYQLTDARGRVLESKSIVGSLTNISMINMAREAYFLRVIHGNRSVKTFKIIKH